MSAVTDLSDRSPECALAGAPGYKELHGDCRQTENIPLPHGRGILLQRRCACGCHRYAGRPGQEKKQVS